MAQISSRPSPFLRGQNICEHLQENQPPGENRLLLPTLTVVGSSIAGKSSVLENITKCPIFPRAKEKSCTKVPIRLRIQTPSDGEVCNMQIFNTRGGAVPLTSTDDALDVITRLTGELGPSELAGEILVVIKQFDVPTMEFVDMPATENGNEAVIEEYLNREGLVLCVVDTDSEVLGPQNAALHAISMAGKLKQTILVLTKADKLAQDELEESLFDRVLKTAAECQYFDQLKGVVAVINRKHTDQTSLLDAADREDERFDEILAAATGHYATAEVQQALRDGTKTQQLLRMMGDLYHD